MDKRHPTTPDPASWPTREAMVQHGMAMNLPWLAFVNISFALIVLLRNVLFDDVDTLYQTERGFSLLVDASMLGVMALSLGLMVLGWRHMPGVKVALFVCSLVWAFSCYWLIVVWQLPHVWPLCVILLLAGMTALYFHLPSLLAFIVPVWLILPVASWQVNHGVNLRFAVIWIVFTLILICGRFILISWFEEAWRRNQQNRRLILRLDALAHQDALTETANRRALEALLDNAVAQRSPFALIMLDVDYFKRYNDTYGHQAGDACLYQVASALKASVRTPDDVVSRYGGEEFVVVLFDCTQSMAQQVAARIQATLRESALAHSASAVSEFVTVSMGIAGYAPGLTPGAIIAQADAALYRAKEAGRNRWCR